MRTPPLVLILARTASRRWQGSIGGVLLARRKKKKRNFANNPLDFFIITKTFKTETSRIYLWLLDESKNCRKIHGGSYYYRDVPYIFTLNF